MVAPKQREEGGNKIETEGKLYYVLTSTLLVRNSISDSKTSSSVKDFTMASRHSRNVRLLRVLSTRPNISRAVKKCKRKCKSFHVLIRLEPHKNLRPSLKSCKSKVKAYQ